MRGTTMRRLALLVAAAVVSGLVAVSAVVAADGGTPSSKATVALDSLIDLSQAASGSASGGASSGSTGWHDVLRSTLKTSSQKDLLFDVSLQCGIVTDTTVKSSGGNTSSASARGTISVRVLVDGRPALPANSIDATGASADGVVFCDRVQTLTAKFAGLNCTADATTGEVTCTDPEELQLILRTLNANAFNFALTDVGVGVHDLVVQAKADAAVNFDDDQSGGSLAGAEAFLGAGTMVVDEVRLVKGLDPEVDLP